MSAKCPLIQKACMKHDCVWWVTVSMTNIQTGSQDIRNMCQVENLSFLLMDLLRNTGGTQAAVESLRNLVVAAPVRHAPPPRGPSALVSGTDLRKVEP